MRLAIVLGCVGFATVMSFAQACSSGGDATPDDGASGGPPPGTSSGGGSTSSGGSSTSSSSSSSSSSSGSSGDAGTDAGDGGDGAAKSVMTFFVTSTGNGGTGGNLGGLAAADAKCLALATAKGGADHTWKAYLSTNNGATLLHAKDRIGAGPWKNQKGKVVANTLAELHGAQFNIVNADVLDENGATVPTAGPNRHDIMTGSNADGTAVLNANCANWTSNTSTNGAMVGHSDSSTGKWNSAHVNTAQGGNVACSANRVAAQGGEGRFYCFATN